MSAARFFTIGPLVVLLPACATSMRAAEKTTVTRGDAALQGEVTVAGGLGGASKEAIYIGVPLTLAVGARVQNPTTILHLESGLEGIGRLRRAGGGIVRGSASAERWSAPAAPTWASAPAPPLRS